MQSMLLYPRRSRFAPNLLKNILCLNINSPGPDVKQPRKYKTPLKPFSIKGSAAFGPI
jgi:hypothetical protein